MDQIAQPTPRHGIMHYVFHFNASLNLVKAVQMMPEAERADALLVNELMQTDYLLDLGDPSHGDASNRCDAVGDD